MTPKPNKTELNNIQEEKELMQFLCLEIAPHTFCGTVLDHELFLDKLEGHCILWPPLKGFVQESSVPSFYLLNFWGGSIFIDEPLLHGSWITNILRCSRRQNYPFHNYAAYRGVSVQLPELTCAERPSQFQACPSGVLCVCLFFTEAAQSFCLESSSSHHQDPL